MHISHGRGWTALLISVGAALCGPARAAVYRVNPQSHAAAPTGKTWATGFRTVAAGVAAARASGDEVWVAAGVYAENLSLPPGTCLYGGFAGTETARAQRDPSHRLSILDGSGHGTVVLARSGASGPSLPSGPSASSSKTTVVDGFTIRNGSAALGGGVACMGANLLLENDAITGNAATTSGGGVYAFRGTPVLSRCLLAGNTAPVGAGPVQHRRHAGPVERDGLRQQHAGWRLRGGRVHQRRRHRGGQRFRGKRLIP